MSNEFEEMGKRAYHKGINAAAMDPTYRTATTGRKVGDKRNVPELKSWNKGWTIENLK